MDNEPACFLWLITQMHPNWQLVFASEDGDISFDADGWNE